MGEDEIQLLTTNGMCDCDTALGFDPQGDTDTLDAEIKKLRRRKWSQSKIDRYLFDREKKLKKIERSNAARGGDSVAMWTDVISTVLNGGASEVGLFYRMYNGTVENEIFQANVMKIDFCNFGEAQFTTMEESAIYYFR